MDSSEWTELAKITARLDELRKLLDAAEDANQIAAFYALEAVITELEATRDRLSIRVRLTPKGRTLRDRLSSMLNRHIEMLGQTQITDTDLQRAAATLQQLERFWMRADISR